MPDWRRLTWHTSEYEGEDKDAQLQSNDEPVHCSVAIMVMLAK